MAFNASRIKIADDIYVSQHLDLRGGLDNSVSDDQVSDNCLTAVSNYLPDFLSAGMLMKREGVSKTLVDQQTEAITSVYQGDQGNYFTTSSTIKQFTSNVDLAGGALSATTAPDWTSLASVDVYVNGTDAPRRIDVGPVVTTLGGSPPNFAYIKAYHNFLFGAGGNAAVGQIRWTDVGTLETWTVTNALVLSDQTDPIRGFGLYKDVLVVFCERSYHHVSGWATLEIVVTYSNFEEGCLSHRSIVSTPYGLFWWSKAGLCRSTDGFSIDYVTVRKVPNTLDTLNKAKYDIVHGVWHPRYKRLQFYCCSRSSNTPDTAFYYYPESDSIWVMTGAGVQMGASGMAVTSGVADVYLGSASTTGYFYKNSGDTDDGTAITAYLETKRDYTQFGPTAIKRCDILTPMGLVVTGVASVTYSVYLDNAVTATNSWDLDWTGGSTFTTGGFILGTDHLGTGTLGAPVTTGTGAVPVESTIGYGRIFKKIKHRISDNNATRPKIRGFVHRGRLIAV